MDKHHKRVAKRATFSLLLVSVLGGCAVYSPAPHGYVESSVHADRGYHDGYYRSDSGDRYRHDGDRYRGSHNRSRNYSTGGSIGVRSPGVGIGIGIGR